MVNRSGKLATHLARHEPSLPENALASTKNHPKFKK
jgi:hypothetical protein